VVDAEATVPFRYAASVILRVIYWKSTSTSKDDLVIARIAEDSKHIQIASRPGAFLVVLLPCLKYVPGYGRVLHEHHEFELSLFRDQLGRVTDDMVGR
jgi:hypothetical protein